MWQPMDTAPKDGTKILIAVKGGWWSGAWKKFYSPFYRREIEGWWTSSDPSKAHVTLPQEALAWFSVPLFNGLEH